MTRTRRYAVGAAPAAALLSAVLLTGAAGCGGSDPDPSGTPTAGTSPAPTSSPTQQTSPAETSPSAPSITPAAGIQLTEASSTIRAPLGWKHMDDLVDYASAATDRTHRNSVNLVDSGDISGGAPLDVQAQSALKNLPEGARASRLPDVQLDGVAAFHIHYTVPGDRSEYDTITTVRNDRNVGLDFILDKRNAATNPELIASVLATFAWIA
ncbi:MAG TPA: hypothetical protein VFV89_07190 [Nocardioides sp.]|uniref:hypothetical protein n=1 Tax=Nocardioides sp. TaxID=35761 RepID=UPI002E381886|nr:hypothetical protein [Nocardioides sp.]HEX5087574.1 hypothetical protein [Nocardioides sp.]